MGLFGFGKEKKAKAEAAVRSALANHPAIEIVIQNIVSPPEEHQWLNTVGGYYDSRLRTVIVAKDTLGVHCCPPSELTKKDSNHEAVRVAFTDLGYTPLPGYKDENGDYILEVARVAELLAEEVKLRISASCPNYTLGNIIVDTDSDSTFQVAYFTYRLPALQWKDWFSSIIEAFVMWVVLLGIAAFIWVCYNIYEAICVWDAGWSLRPCKNIDNLFMRRLLHVAGAPGAILGIIVGIITFKWKDWI